MSDTIIINKNGEEFVLTEKRIKSLTSKFIELCSEDAVYSDDFGKNSMMVKLLTDVKKAFFPATNKNVNMNIQSFDKQLEAWANKRNELKKEQGYVEIINNKEEKTNDTE